MEYNSFGKIVWVPMLYTNADYTASNACYEKIDYVLQGKLCTIGKIK
jgi:predicted GNAT family acetyltransferase